MSANNNDQLVNELAGGGYLKTPEIIAAFRAINRADFVLPEYKNEAYRNYPLPILAGQTISQPLTVAFMLELLEPQAGEKILDIGAGSGWQTSLLAHAVSKAQTYTDDMQTDADNIIENDFLYPELTYKIRGAAFDAKKKLGLGHKEKIYQNALEEEFIQSGISFEKEKTIRVFYNEKNIGVYRPDFVVNGKVLIELKSIPFLGKIAKLQFWNYLKGSPYKVGLLINFGGKDIEIVRRVYDSARFGTGRRKSASDLRWSAGHIVAIERIPELCEFARDNIEKYGLIHDGVVVFHCQDATATIPDGPYDKIIAAAAASKDIPDEWREKLKIGGKIVAPIAGSIWRFTKKSETEWREEEFPGFAFVPLVSDTNSREQRETRTAANSTIHEQTRTAAKQRNSLFILIATLLVIGCALLVYQIYLPHADFRGSKTVIVETGLGSRKIGAFLKYEGVIDSKWAFVLYVSLKGSASDLKPGTYVWQDSITIPELTHDLLRGGSIERVITIPEGWGVRDIAEYFTENSVAPQDEFLRLAGAGGAAHFRGDFSFLADAPQIAGLEGYLFPDTYRIFRDATSKDIIIKMLANFDKKLTPDLREEITRRKKTIFDIVRMASLIEKEVISDEDRAIVSGILWKRLRLGIPLQVDATVVYANQLTTDNQQPTTRITTEDTKIDSPYNTYKYYGLPPGPIANPGISAIRAAIEPKESEFLYYLSAPDGRTIFSRTLHEHNAAIKKYLK